MAEDDDPQDVGSHQQADSTVRNDFQGQEMQHVDPAPLYWLYPTASDAYVPEPQFSYS
jgi:hypothetical protein